MSNVVTLQDTKKGWGSNAPTSSYSTSTMDKSRMVSTFKPFFGDSKKAANAEETPVEARMRRTLVHTLVKHSMRCASKHMAVRHKSLLRAQALSCAE